jgi:DNA-binding CsgD family transcriptional regulator
MGDELSRRELDIIRLLASGQTNRETAQALFLSPKTVARHLNSAMHKLDALTRTALAVRAINTGIVSSPTH